SELEAPARDGAPDQDAGDLAVAAEVDPESHAVLQAPEVGGAVVVGFPSGGGVAVDGETSLLRVLHVVGTLGIEVVGPHRQDPSEATGRASASARVRGGPYAQGAADLEPAQGQAGGDRPDGQEDEDQGH